MTDAGMNDLVERFAALIDDLEVPDIDLVDRVMDDLERQGNPEYRRRPHRLLAVAAAVIIAAIAVVTIGPSRRAVADFFGIGAVRFDPGQFESGGTEQTPPVSGSTDTDPVQPEAVVVNPIPSLGTPMVTDGPAARRRTYSWPGPNQPEVTLEVRTIDGPLEFKQRAAEPGIEFISLTLTLNQAEAGSVEVNALWIPTPHQRITADGEPTITAGPTLIWVDDDIQYRLEANIDRDAAIALAEQVLGGTDLLSGCC